MLNRAIVIVLLALGAAFVLVPRAGDSGKAKAPADATGTQLTTLDDEPETSGSRRGGETTLSRAPDGHYYAEVSVGGKRATMLVDTGASIIALTGTDARALGLSWHPADLQVIGHGASGEVLGVPATLPEVELDGHRVRDVEAAIIPEGLSVSLLGQSFLSEIGRVEIENGEMVLGSR